jgi:hypothetical protein
MNTSQITWKFFNEVLLEYAKISDVIGFDHLVSLIRKIGKVYDNRTVKSWIDCMQNNFWLTPIEPNPHDILGQYVVTSLYKYRQTKWKINKNAKYNFSPQQIQDIINNMAKENQQQP